VNGQARPRPGPDVVMAFLSCGGRRDFSAARDLLDENVVRSGAGGHKSGRDAYLAYLGTVMKDALDYRYSVKRCIESKDGRTVVVEIDESLTRADGTALSVSEAMVFDLTPAGRIARITVYG
jgi:ketosteroid isomerase-like protein